MDIAFEAARITLKIIFAIIRFFISILPLLFKIAKKLRLTGPLAYLLIGVVSAFFIEFTPAQDKYIMWGLFILIGLSALSWIYSLVKLIKNRVGSNASNDDIVNRQNNEIEELIH